MKNFSIILKNHEKKLIKSETNTKYILLDQNTGKPPAKLIFRKKKFNLEIYRSEEDLIPDAIIQDYYIKDMNCLIEGNEFSIFEYSSASNSLSEIVLNKLSLIFTVSTFVYSKCKSEKSNHLTIIFSSPLQLS